MQFLKEILCILYPEVIILTIFSSVFLISYFTCRNLGKNNKS